MFVAQIWEAPYVAKSNECACNEIDSEVHCPVPDRHTKSASDVNPRSSCVHALPQVQTLRTCVCLHRTAGQSFVACPCMHTVRLDVLTCTGKDECRPRGPAVTRLWHARHSSGSISHGALSTQTRNPSGFFSVLSVANASDHY